MQPQPPWTNEGRQDPFPWYAHMRVTEPVTWLEEVGAYAVFRYDDVRAVLADDDTFSVAARVAVMPERQRRVSVVSDTLIGTDPPVHTRLRSLVAPAFRPSAIGRMQDKVEQVSADLLEQCLPLRAFDFVTEYARPLPETVIAEMLGIPAGQRDRYSHLTTALERSVGYFLGHGLDEEQLAVAEGAFDEYAEFAEELITQRRDNLGEDFISDLIRARDENDRLSDHEMLKMVILLNVAGATTTQTLIATLLLELDRHPQMWSLLKDRPELVPRAVDEALRYHGTTHSVSRVTTRYVELGGCSIPAGSTILLFLAAADRDEEAFESAESFDITRPVGRQLAFAVGAHYCLGAPLARREAEVFLRHWLQRVEAFSCPADPLAWAKGRLSNIILESLPVEVSLAS
jgi:cytochrome P450